MDYLHYKVHVKQGEIIRVSLDEKTDVTQAVIRLLDSLNYFKYRSGKKYIETTRSQHESPVRLKPPYKGEWHVVIDMGGRRGVVKARVDVLAGS